MNNDNETQTSTVEPYLPLKKALEALKGEFPSLTYRALRKAINNHERPLPCFKISPASGSPTSVRLSDVRKYFTTVNT